MNFSHIFGVFSKRNKTSGRGSNPLPPEFRHRVLQLCTETFTGYQGMWGTPHISLFWSDIHSKLRYLHGRPTLANTRTTSIDADAINFLLNCCDNYFLDFVEMIFHSPLLWETPPTLNGQAIDPQELVESVNHLFEVDELPYYLTRFSFPEAKPTEVHGVIQPYLPSSGPPMIEAYPQVIRRESQTLHETAIEPALLLLTNPALTEANREFLEALGHYRKGEYADCLSKCGSSFESVMKVICDRKGWPYKQTDTASTLLSTVLPKTSLEPFFKEPLTLVATMRNRLSRSHGAGVQHRTVSKHVGQYAVNATASAILLLVEETNP